MCRARSPSHKIPPTSVRVPLLCCAALRSAEKQPPTLAPTRWRRTSVAPLTINTLTVHRFEMPLHEEDIDNICEGCRSRNTGENFSHAGFCKACMHAMMHAPHEDVLKGEEQLANRFLNNITSKVGALTTWRDTDGHEVEIILPIPPGVDKKELVMKVTPLKLLVRAGERKLLFVDPLYDYVQADQSCWCLELAEDGSTQMQISLTKAVVGTRWGKTLCKEGGFFECWKNSLLEAPIGESKPAKEAYTLAATSATTAAEPTCTSLTDPSFTKEGKKKPRFTMRDDGTEVEVNLPLPPDVTDKKQLEVRASPMALSVYAKKRCLLDVTPLAGEIIPDELV